MNEPGSVELREKVARLEGDVVACERDVGEVKKKLDSQDVVLHQLQTMNANIAVLTEQVTTLATASAKLESRVIDVEKRPAKRWDAIVGALIAGAVGILMAYLTK